MKSFTALGLLLLLTACQSNSNNPQTNHRLIGHENFEKQLQEALITATKGMLIQLPAGQFTLQRQLSFNDAKSVTIKGAGSQKTVLSFKDQLEGAEGLMVKNANGIVLEGFTIEDTKGDAIKVQHSKEVVFRDVQVRWTNGPSPQNGAYGLYPVSCTNVLLEDCEASFAMDAGIYVGQSNNITVRRCFAHHNVAGIEIENSSNGAVYDNRCEQNAGGLLIFDMPDIPVANGAKIRVYNNQVFNNNFPNFSAPGNVVNILPPGTGMLLMAHTQMEVFNNQIIGHNTLGMGIVSWLFTGKPYKSKTYVPYCSAIEVYNNRFEQGGEAVDTTTDFGRLMVAVVGGYKDILTDGIFDPNSLTEEGGFVDKARICLHNNGPVRFVNLNAAAGAQPADMIKNKNEDSSIYDCTLDSININGHDSWMTKLKPS